jgi:hypothetical protein
VIPRGACVLAKVKVPQATAPGRHPSTAQWKPAAGTKPPAHYECNQCGKKGDHYRDDCKSTVRLSNFAGIPKTAKQAITDQQALAGVNRVGIAVLSCCACALEHQQFQLADVDWLLRSVVCPRGCIAVACHHSCDTCSWPCCLGMLLFRNTVSDLVRRLLHNSVRVWCWPQAEAGLVIANDGSSYLHVPTHTETFKKVLSRVWLRVVFAWC